MVSFNFTTTNTGSRQIALLLRVVLPLIVFVLLLFHCLLPSILPVLLWLLVVAHGQAAVVPGGGFAGEREVHQTIRKDGTANSIERHSRPVTDTTQDCRANSWHALEEQACRSWEKSGEFLVGPCLFKGDGYRYCTCYCSAAATAPAPVPQVVLSSRGGSGRFEGADGGKTPSSDCRHISASLPCHHHQYHSFSP